MKITNRVNPLNDKNTLKIFSSNFMCIKIFITSADLIAAINNATNKVYLPKLTPAIVTVIDVNASSAIHTNTYVP